MCLTDILVFTCIFLFTLNGWYKGFLRTMLGPLSLVLGTLITIIYIQKTYNVLLSLALLIFGPMVIDIVLSTLLAIWHKEVDKSLPISLASHFLGGLLNCFWGVFLATTFIMTFVLIPTSFLKFPLLQEDIPRSYSYSLVMKFAKDRLEQIPYIKDVKKIIETSQNPTTKKEIQSAPEFNSIYRDPLMRQIISDKETLRQLQEKDMGKIMTNPKILAILQNKNLMEKIMKLNYRLLENNPSP